MTHLSLFSGIGGLDLAAEWAGFETVGQCEFADFPHAVLTKHWPDVPKWRDVHDLTATDFFARTGLETVTVISGGFPCQPHSKAGSLKGSRDERDLWPEFRRIIREIKPRWVVAENVPRLLASEDGRFFGRVLNDLAELGFDAGWAVFPACWFGAIHRRERVAIIAYAHSNRRTAQLLQTPKAGCNDDTQHKPGSTFLLEGWRADFPGVCGKYDGASDWMDRLKSLGNAVVPQQFYPIFKAIAEIEEATP